MPDATPALCPICLLPDCTVDHEECSPPPEPGFCDGCGAKLRRADPEGVCGFCREEALLAAGSRP